MTARLSSSGSWALLKNCASLVVPVGPPSALAPLSETTMTIVLSRSPCSRRKSSRRPRWWSVWLRKPANTSIIAGGEAPRVRRQGIPLGHVGVVARQLGVGRDDAELLLAGERLLPVGVPAVVELARVLVGPLLRHVVRGVGRPEAQVQVERLVGVDLAAVGDELDRLVDEVLGQVVALLRRPRAARPGGCRRRARGTTGWCRRRGSRRSAGSRVRAASGRTGRRPSPGSLGVRCHLPTM